KNFRAAVWRLLTPSLPPRPQPKTADRARACPARASARAALWRKRSRHRKEPMKIIDTLEIPFPKTIEELTALDSTREVPYLKAICNRRHIHTPGPNPSPSEIIPIIEQRLREHQSLRPDPRFQSDLLIEWTAAHNE